MNTLKKINFAIVGCGMIAHAHAGAISEIPQASLIGAWDLNDEAKTKFCDKYKIEQYSSFESILRDKNIDAVCLCTPSLYHAEQAIVALNAGKHVVVEKPMALSADEAKQACITAKNNQKLLTVIFQNRFAEEIRYVKKLIEDNVFGKLCFCDLYMKFHRDASYYSESAWRGTLKYDGGGALMNQGIHGVDLMNYLVGKARLIAGKTKTQIHNIEAEDSAVAMLEYDCGAIGVIEASTCVFPGFRRRVEINGERGYVIISDSVIEKLYIDGKFIISNDFDPHPTTASSPALASHELHKLQISNFVSAINGEEELVSSAEDGYYAVKLIESIYNSSQNDIVR